jgi:hypothetical protein
MSVSMRIALRTLHGFAGTDSGTGILRTVPQLVMSVTLA